MHLSHCFNDNISSTIENITFILYVYSTGTNVLRKTIYLSVYIYFKKHTVMYYVQYVYVCVHTCVLLNYYYYYSTVLSVWDEQKLSKSINQNLKF